MNESYAPCRTGIHICGISADEAEPVTVANFPMRSAREAHELFLAARSQFAARDGEPDDLIVDYCSGGDITEDFPLCRQQLAGLQAFLEQELGNRIMGITAQPA